MAQIRNPASGLSTSNTAGRDINARASPTRRCQLRAIAPGVLSAHGASSVKSSIRCVSSCASSTVRFL